MDISFDEWVRNDASQPCVKTYADALIKLGTYWDSFRRLDEAGILQDLVDAGGIPLLAARDIVRIARLEIEKSEAPMAIFWDIENTPIPSNTSGREVVSRLKSILEPFERLTNFRAYASIAMNLIPQAERSDLQLSGCHLVDCPHHGRKEVADKMIIVDAMKFAFENPDGAAMCFITADIDYTYMLAILQRPCWRTIVISKGTISSMLHVNCDMRMRWETDILQLRPSTLEAATSRTSETLCATKVIVSEDAKSTDTAASTNMQDDNSKLKAIKRKLSLLRTKGFETLSLFEEWTDDVELLRMILKAKGNSLFKQQVGSRLRTTNPARFGSHSTVKNFLAKSIEQGVVIESGEGPCKELILPSSVPTIKRIAIAKFISSDMFDVMTNFSDVSGKGLYLMFAPKSCLRGIACKPKWAYVRDSGRRWLLLIFMSIEDAQKAVEKLPQLTECTLVDRRACQLLDERYVCGYCCCCRNGLLESEIIYQASKDHGQGKMYQELAYCSDCYKWDVRDGEKEKAVTKVVDMMTMLAEYDDILVGRNPLKKQLYLRYTDMGLCTTHKHAELWIDAAIETDYIALFKKSGLKKIWLCLAGNLDVAHTESDLDDTPNTLREEEYILNCLSDIYSQGWISRRTINKQLTSKFSKMNSPFLRSRVLTNGMESKRFAVAKGPYGQTVAFTQKEAQESLECMTKSMKGELEWEFELCPHNTSDQGSMISSEANVRDTCKNEKSMKDESPKVPLIIAAVPSGAVTTLSQSEPKQKVETDNREKEASVEVCSDWDEESIDSAEIDSCLRQQIEQNFNKYSPLSNKKVQSKQSLPILFARTNQLLLALIAIGQIAQGLALSNSLAGQRFVGFDLGTSGARISVIEPTSVSNATIEEIYSKAITWSDCGSYDDAEAWMIAIESLLMDVSNNLEGGLRSVTRVCVSGTSASCLVVDRKSQAVTRGARMYDYDILTAASDDKKKYAEQALACIERHVPKKHTARARTGSLAKLLCWAYESPLQKSESLCHQSEFVAMKLMGSFHPIKSDWHNCLKLGYDVRNTCWPDWIKNCLNDAGVSTPSDNDILGAVPTEVVSPGAPMGTISREMADRLGLQEGTVVVGGTTDSNAAFFAAAGTKPSFATAVTSLGSTTAIKLLSPQYIEDASRGVYSHRFPIFDGVDGSNDKKELWLVGGASNVGCVIFRTLNFSNDELESLSKNIDPMKDSPLSYYPLVMKGERFPVADPYKEPILDPVPESRQEYLHGLLQSIANVESGGFHVLGELGAPLPKLVLSCGGGAKNSMWTKMRQRLLAEALGVPDIQVKRAVNTEASFGAALLAAAMVALVTK